jgi:hypothetical protein
MKCFFQFLLALSCLASPLLARVINVPGEYATIQAGIDASANGDTVLVAPGNYSETLSIPHNILLTSAQGPDTCVIGGSLSFQPQIDTTCRVRGFRLFNVRISTASPIIEANIVHGSPAIGMHLSNGIIRSNIVSNNHGWSPPGISAEYGYPVIENNVVWGNSIINGDAGSFGAGIYFRSGIIRRNIIARNIVSSGYGMASGGGVYRNLGDSCEIYNNTIVRNNAVNQHGGGGPGGILLIIGNDKFINNIVAFNYHGGALFSGDTSRIFQDYNLFYENGGSVDPGPHDLWIDPQFVDTIAGDFHLLPGSPCIDAGDPSSPLDPDSTRADIGAYFFDQSVGIDEPGAPTGPYEFSLRQNYPNPFNAQTIISYCLDKEATVSLHIYAITGHLVRPLLNKEIQNAGEHNYIWDGRNTRGEMVSTGIYFYELYVDDSRESKAMIMVK